MSAFVELLRKSNLDYSVCRKPFKVGSRSDDIIFASFIDIKTKKLQLIACLDKPDSVTIWSTSLDERAFQLNARLLDITELGETMTFLSERINESDFTLAKSASTNSDDQYEVSQVNVTFTHPKNKQSITLQLYEHIDENEKALFLSKILLHVCKRNEQLTSEVKTQQLRIKELSTKTQRAQSRLSGGNRSFDGNKSLDSNGQKGNINNVSERTQMSLINPTLKRRKAASGSLMSITSVPNTKQIQYDRQLRLWGDHGQKALESGRVCLIGANALGTEILKALVLPGLGSFTIIDHQLVTLADCGSNFFVHPSMIDQPRARVTCELLSQLNPDVHGAYIDKPSIDDLLKQNTFDFSPFNVVITANLSFNTLSILASHLWTLKTPLLIARSYGFIGMIRLQVYEHYVIEAHPDDTIPDLRLDRPLPELINHCNSIDFDLLTREEHLHLPSLIILYKTLQLWQKQYNRTDLPRTRAEKEEFKKILEQLSHHSAYDTQDQNKSLENFEEAKRTIPSRLVSTNLPLTMKNLFQDQSCLELTDQSHIFWFIIHALKQFIENEGQGLLPVRGEVPDMITNTNSYVKLVEIYQKQAKKDCEIVYNYLNDLLEKYRCPSNGCMNLHHLVQIYCKNAAFLQVLRTSALKKQDDFKPEETDSNLSWYIGLQFCDLFYEKYNRYPGEHLSDDEQFRTDFDDLKRIHKQRSIETCTHENIQSTLEELCRYGASEIHSIAAFIGGCCAQEAIKLITHQYVPMNNTLIYNGIEQSISVFKL
ncbi:hypothetical protein I4U23_026378 [Adineta vaga]|nr:hypothetical protein I4U23_026378 [Adineta vaga]